MLKETDYIFIALTFFAIIVFAVTFYEVNSGDIETTPLYEDKTPHMIITMFAFVWACFLFIHILLRNKLWIDLPLTSVGCGIYLFSAVHDIVGVIAAHNIVEVFL